VQEWALKIKELHNENIRVIMVNETKQYYGKAALRPPEVQLLIKSARLPFLMKLLDFADETVTDELNLISLTTVNIVWHREVNGSCEYPDWIGLSMTPCDVLSIASCWKKKDAANLYHDWGDSIARWLAGAVRQLN